jgi:hypothetical protein
MSAAFVSTTFVSATFVETFVPAFAEALVAAFAEAFVEASIASVKEDAAVAIVVAFARRSVIRTARCQCQARNEQTSNDRLTVEYVPLLSSG